MNRSRRPLPILRASALLLALALAPRGAVADPRFHDPALDGSLPRPGDPGATVGQLLPEAIPSPHLLAVYYVVPTDITYRETIRERLVQATRDVQAWYQCASGGRTWTLAFPETVRVYFGSYSHDDYHANGDWWGSLLGEMQGRGCPIWTPGYAVALWAQGAGFWAGSAQACGVDCGTSLLGVELFPEFNDSTYSHAECPPGVGPAAWPCTPEGAYAHELGHILGLVHPDGVPATQPVAGHSIMLTHWNFPDYAPPAEAPWGFLTVERQQLSSNPFMGLSVPTDQIYHDCDVVNLPAPPSIPTAAFTWLGGPNSVSFQNQSTGAVQYLWDFGDGATSNTATPVHPYAAGSYTVTLRAMADGGGLAMVQHALDVVGVAGGAGAEAALAIAPNPVRLSGDRSALRLRFALMRPEEVGLGLYTPAGRLVATRAAVPLAAGAQEISWDLAGAAARSLPPGVYALRLDAGAESRRATVIVLR